MKALVNGAVGGGFELEDVDIAAPVGHEVLVEVRASGLCHTDLTIAVEAVRDLLPGGADHVFDFVGLNAVSELREVNDGYAALKDGSLTRVVVTSF